MSLLQLYLILAVYVYGVLLLYNYYVGMVLQSKNKLDLVYLNYSQGDNRAFYCFQNSSHLNLEYCFFFVPFTRALVDHNVVAYILCDPMCITVSNWAAFAIDTLAYEGSFILVRDFIFVFFGLVSFHELFEHCLHAIYCDRVSYILRDDFWAHVFIVGRWCVFKSVLL